MLMTETKDLFLEGFEADVIHEEWCSNSSRVLKRDLVKMGEKYILSLYGAVGNKETKELLGVRIEILSAEEYSVEDVRLLYEYFKQHPFQLKYSIWLYDRDHVNLDCMGVYP
jgi:hypothetical protein